MAFTVIGLNWIDLICTLLALRRGCVELNPLMRSVATMVWYKIAIVPLLVLVLACQGTLLSEISGVKDFATFTMNGGTTNIKLAQEEYPETGDMVFTE